LYARGKEKKTGDITVKETGSVGKKTQEIDIEEIQKKINKISEGKK